MGWEGIHLYQFRLRAAGYGSPELAAASPDATLSALRFRKGARFLYEYDLNIPWRHEVRVEDRTAPADTIYPACTGGSVACPPEGCGGLASFKARREDLLSLEALDDLETTAEILGKVARRRRRELLEDGETRHSLTSGIDCVRTSRVGVPAACPTKGTMSRAADWRMYRLLTGGARPFDGGVASRLRVATGH